MSTYYEVLDISKTATAQELRQAYYRKAKQFHPDKNKDTHAAEQFKRIAEAYEVLSDPEKRKQYDRQYSDSTSYNTQTSYNNNNKYDYFLYELSEYLKILTFEEGLALLDEIQEDILECYDYHRRSSRSADIALGKLLDELPKKYFPFLINLMEKADKLDISLQNSTDLWKVLGGLKLGKKICFLTLIGEERLEKVLKVGKGNFRLLEECPQLQDLPSNSPLEKILERAYNPPFLLRVLSVLDVCPLLSLILPPIGFAYIFARIINEGNRLTNQKFSFFAWHDSNYCEFGLYSNFKPFNKNEEEDLETCSFSEI